jgi:hypothetical protein
MKLCFVCGAAVENMWLMPEATPTELSSGTLLSPQAAAASSSSSSSSSARGAGASSARKPSKPEVVDEHGAILVSSGSESCTQLDSGDEGKGT